MVIVSFVAVPRPVQGHVLSDGRTGRRERHCVRRVRQHRPIHLLRKLSPQPVPSWQRCRTGPELRYQPHGTGQDAHAAPGPRQPSGTLLEEKQGHIQEPPGLSCQGLQGRGHEGSVQGTGMYHTQGCTRIRRVLLWVRVSHREGDGLQGKRQHFVFACGWRTCRRDVVGGHLSRRCGKVAASGRWHGWQREEV